MEVVVSFVEKVSGKRNPRQAKGDTGEPPSLGALALSIAFLLVSVFHLRSCLMVLDRRGGILVVTSGFQAGRRRSKEGE